jgi:hypothetical protein
MKKFSFFVLFAFAGALATADEGMWLFNRFPREQVKSRYGVEISQAVLDHLRLSSVRLGASGSFVSPRGLILTNHHVASRCIQRVSSAEHNYMANGFYAAAEAEELKCPGSEANVLLSIEDVTAKVNAGIQAKAGSAEANEQRRAAMASIEKDCAARSGRQCDVVTLHSGALYQLYEYKKYTDIRLVFAPEEALACFGGDPDNFTYPRFDLDIAFLRAYENGRPASTPNYLKWSKEGVKDGELVLVSGNPASTDRFITTAEWEYQRDTAYPQSLRSLEGFIKVMLAFGSQSPESKRVARDKVFSAQNSYKARAGEYKGLRDARLFAEKKAAEEKLRAAVEADPKWRNAAQAWDEIAAAYREWAPYAERYALLESGGRYSDLFTIVRGVLRLAAEKRKPNGERLREYTDAALPSLELRLFSAAPISDTAEIAALSQQFAYMRDRLGSSDAVVQAVLGGRSPDEAAGDYVSASKLKDVAVRNRLAASLDEVMRSDDGMMRLARILDGPARELRKRHEDRLTAVVSSSGAKIAQARFVLRGTAEYPDATGTLRLSYGVVKGYRNEWGQWVPYAMDFGGLYSHATGEEPFKLPQRWLEARAALSLKTPLNFVSTADIIGGNSGSPTVNAKGEVIGIIFDSNIEALPNRFQYSETTARAVHVAGQGIIEALRKIYRAQRVLEELGQ